MVETAPLGPSLPGVEHKRPSDVKKVEGVDIVPTEKIPSGKKALAFVLGLDPEKAVRDPLFNQIYDAFVKKGDFRHPKTGELLIKDGEICLDEPLIGKSKFQILIGLVGDKDFADEIKEYNATMTLGNQKRSGEPNVTNLERIIGFYRQCSVNEKIGNALANPADIKRAMRRLLTADIKFLVVKGDGNVAKSFLQYYKIGTNPMLDKYLETLMREYELKSIKELIGNTNALKALDEFIGQMLLREARDIDGMKVRQMYGMGDQEEAVRELFKKAEDPAIAKRLGAAAAYSFATGKKLDVDWIESPPSAADVIEKSSESIFEKMNPETREIIAKRLGIPVDELSDDRLVSIFKNDVWLKLKDSQRKEIEEELQTNPSSREVFAKLMLEYFKTGKIGEDPAESFYSCFFGRNRDKLPDNADITLGQLSAGVTESQMIGSGMPPWLASLLGGGR